MARDLESSTLAALTTDPVYPRNFFEGVFDGTTLRYWTGSYDITWDSQTWSGNGLLKRISDFNESGDLSPNNLEIELTGEPSALVSIALNSASLNMSGKVWLGLLDSSGAIIAEPCLLFEGLLDSVELDDEIESASLVLTYENRLIALEHAKGYSYNHETQQIFYSGDLGFEYHAQMEDWTGFWGKPQKNKKPKGEDGESDSPRKKKKKRKKTRRRKR